MPPVGFEPTILASERQQTHSLDRTATGIGKLRVILGLTKSNCYEQSPLMQRGHDDL
jgi:hypothetical protein